MAMSKSTILFLCVLAFIANPVSAAERRVALVIGNSAYANAPLRNPVNDAQDMAKVLRGLGFRVIHKSNVDRKTLRRSFREFRERLHTDTVGLFYFAGHGMQVAGRNYLIPVGADVAGEDEIPDEAVAAAAVLRKMESAGNRMNIVILDACRNNPFARSFRSGSRGLARMDAPVGSIVAYATAPDSVAADGAGRNGVYTKHLLTAIQTPELSIEYMFKQVRNRVIEETGGSQTPWEESSLRGNFYFSRTRIPDSPHVTAPDNRPAGSTGLATAESEIVFWQSIQGDRECEDYRAYLASYPNGRFRVLARVRRDQYCTIRAELSDAKVEPEEGMNIREVLEECEAHLKANRLTTGAGGTALECYREVLSRDRGNDKALAGLNEIEARYLKWAKASLDRKESKRADEYIRRLSMVNADHPALISLENRRDLLDRPQKTPTPIISRPQTPNNKYVRCLLPGSRQPVWHQLQTCLRLRGRVVADNQDHVPSSVQTTGKNPYIQCLLRGSTKPVWHKKQTCLTLKGRVVVDSKGKNATVSVPRDDHYIRCALPGQSKPVWHKKTSCLSQGGREVRN